MGSKLDFKAFCIEVYKASHGLTGKEVIELFTRYGVLDYIDDFYDTLHTQGEAYIISDLEQYISVREEKS